MENLNRKHTIKDIPEEERPRERMEKFGPEALSNSELLAIILRTGTAYESALDISNRLLKEGNGIKCLYEYSFQELKHIKGIGNAKASQIKAALELGRRLKSYKDGSDIYIKTPHDAAELVMEDMRHLKKECLKLMMLNTKNMVISIKDISVGGLNFSVVHPREIFVEAIKVSSASIIIFHNHPSGDPYPSQEDIDVTKRIYKAGKIVGIDLIDHIIIGDNKFSSLREKGII
ncbi:MAG TPA: hypothetical protein DD429_09205 [Clostridiaceae bacterium]|nr:hypothetical protein [Clostridiaceae bacterium]